MILCSKFELVQNYVIPLITCVYIFVKPLIEQSFNPISKCHILNPASTQLEVILK